MRASIVLVSAAVVVALAGCTGPAGVGGSDAPVARARLEATSAPLAKTDRRAVRLPSAVPWSMMFRGIGRLEGRWQTTGVPETGEISSSRTPA
jgi:hypothetical protein